MMRWIDSGWRRPPGRSRRTLAPGLAAAILAASAPVALAEPESATHVLLINGGGRPAANYLSHLHHLEDMIARLTARGVVADQIHVFSADGPDDTPDLAVREPRPERFWLIDDTRIGRRLRPRKRYVDTRLDGFELRPATVDSLESWVLEEGIRLGEGDTLLVFVTDHGEENPDDLDDGTISLWHEDLSVTRLEELLDLLPPPVRVVFLMSQCFSGTFASLMREDRVGWDRDWCGFFSTYRDRPAYGCYPEGRDVDRIGHAFRFIDALGRAAPMNVAHYDVVEHDRTPDVPLATSDVLAGDVLDETARARGQQPAALVDELLARAWNRRAYWEPVLRRLDRLGHAYGLFSPRSLEELALLATQLDGMAERMQTYADRWEIALRDLKQEQMRRFRLEHPDWDSRLEESELRELDDADREVTAAELLLEFEAFVDRDAEVRARLDRLREQHESSSQAQWRLDVRRAAIERMRLLLLGVAVRELQRTEGLPADWSLRIDRVRTCESWAPGGLSGGPDAPAPSESYPPLAHEAELLEQVLPGWLGIRFRNPPREGEPEESVGPPEVQVVYPDSPAAAAGLQPGDRLLGPPGEPFDEPRRLREWTMTSPTGVPLTLEVLRPEEGDRPIPVQLVLQPYPLEWPELPSPPQVGDLSPVLPEGLDWVAGEPIATAASAAPSGHLLFFWATWCIPCKNAVPEVRAFAAERALPVVAISDEASGTLSSFLSERTEPFFDRVVSDTSRRTLLSHGVSGTPTLIWVDGEGTVVHREVGYRSSEGLAIDGWDWRDR